MTQKRQVSWPGWEVVRPIGSGSFGTVYEIRREIFGREEHAALKVITIPQEREEIEELYREGYDQASITDHIRGYLEDIVREYSLMMEIKGHTNVVCCDDLRYVQHDDSIGWDIYIKMELLTALSKALSKTYDEQETIKLGMDLCSALILCRQENIVHRDIKPANIFVSKNGDYKLGDFGVAKIAEKTVSGTKIGTYDYMAPEVYNCQPYGTPSDMYSLGLVLYWMMNDRRTPFLPDPSRIPTADEKETARRRRFQGEPLPPPSHGSYALKQVVLKACAFRPEDRFADPQQMRQALAAISGSEPQQEANPSGSGSFQPAQFNHPTIKPNYPPVNPNRRPPQGYPPMQPNRPPVQPGRPPMQPNYPPMQPNRPPMQPGRPPMQPNYPPMQPGRPPMQPNYPPMQPNYPPMQPNRPPMQPNRPPMQPGYPPVRPHYPPAPQGYPPFPQNNPPMCPSEPVRQDEDQPDENGIVWKTPGDL